MSISGRDSNLDLNARLQADASDLLDDLAGRVQVDEALVNLQLKAIPCLRTFTTRSLTSGDLEDLSGETDGAFYSELFIFRSVDEVGRELLEVLDIATGEGNTDLVDFGLGDWCTGGIIFLFTLSDVTHPDSLWRVRW